MSRGADGEPSGVNRGRSLSFSELYDTHDGLAYARAMEVLGDHHLAEDAVQETFVRVARALERGFRPEFPGPWIRAIARNEALRIAGRKRMGRELHGEVPTGPPQEKVDDLDEHRKVRETLGRMDAEEARLLADRYLENETPESLSRREGLSGSGFWRRLRVAKESFRRRFGRPPGSEERG
jgi:RNA polymerase sigma-70 factor (ECF subfamily)